MKSQDKFSNIDFLTLRDFSPPTSISTNANVYSCLTWKTNNFSKAEFSNEYDIKVSACAVNFIKSETSSECGEFMQLLKF
jgi:hypothetical protein